jgi:hypothetical protein
VAAAADGQHQEGKLAVRVEVQNAGAPTVMVDPKTVSFSLCHRPDAGPRGCGPPVRALDPERLLLGLDQAAARQRAAASDEAALGGALLLLDAVALVGAVASGSGRGVALAADNAAAVTVTTGAAAEGHGRMASAFGNERQSLAARALRLTTLPPGQGVAGLVYLPGDLPGGWLRLSLEVGGQRFQFPFRVVVDGVEPSVEPASDR